MSSNLLYSRLVEGIQLFLKLIALFTTDRLMIELNKWVLISGLPNKGLFSYLFLSKLLFFWIVVLTLLIHRFLNNIRKIL